MKKVISFLLLTILIFTAAACSTDTGEPAAATTEAAVTEVPIETDVYGREYIASALPAGLDFNGEAVTVFLRDAASIFDTKLEFIAESENGEVVNDAIYKRNTSVEEILNVDLVFQISPGTDYNVYATSVRKSHMSGDNAYDIYSMYAYFCVELAAEGLLYNLNKLPYLDLEKPWWNANFVDEITLFDRLYYIVGDISLTATQCTHSMFFNKQLTENFYKDLNLYDVVDKGAWTIDYFGSLVKDTYIDINGNSKRDSEDSYGVVLHGVSIPVDAYLDAFDLAVTTKDSEGIPQLTYKNERSISAYEKIFNLMHNNTGVGFERISIEAYYAIQDRFNNSENVFLIDIFIATEKLRDMENDYGVLPMFKYDEAQDGYYTNTADIYSLFGIAAGTKNPEMTGAVMELLGEKSYEFVIPSYFEIALKQKYARDNIDANMYDLILKGNRFNFGFVYSYPIGNVIHMWRGLLDGKKTEFVSGYDAAEQLYIKNLDKLVSQYRELED
ncbi:MAG: hypothetical protein ACYC00_18375 [Eubacteriales bacterium]